MRPNYILFVGVVLIFLGICMCLWGVHMFAYRGDFTPLMSKTGEFSFVFFLPVLIIGLILTLIGIKRIKKDKK
jgi:uncharacterized membrane protein